MNRVVALAVLVALAACGDPTAARQNTLESPTTSSAMPTTTAQATTTTPIATTTATSTTTPIVATTSTSTSTTSTTTTPVVEPSSAPSAAPSTGEVLALDTLSFITVENEHRGGYVRDLFGYPADLDGDGCDTRAEVLRAESITPAQVDPYGCTVVAGDWLSLYDGLTVTSPGELEIDHVVSLKEAWDSGAWQWSAAALVAYANDLSDERGLRAVTVATNRAKGDKDPSNWLPPDAAAVCPFIGDWVAVKVRWGLSMDQSEFGRIRNLLTGPCEGWRIATVEPPPVSTDAVPSPAPAPVPVAGLPPADVYYKNCTAARAAGVTPLHVGDPGYRTALDGDKDGIACE